MRGDLVVGRLGEEAGERPTLDRRLIGRRPDALQVEGVKPVMRISQRGRRDGGKLGSGRGRGRRKQRSEVYEAGLESGLRRIEGMVRVLEAGRDDIFVLCGRQEGQSQKNHQRRDQNGDHGYRPSLPLDRLSGKTSHG